MIETSTTYKRLLADPNHTNEIRLAIGDSGVLITERADTIIFGEGTKATRILIARSGADSGYNESRLISITTKGGVFKDSTPTIGCCVSAEIDVKMKKPLGDIPRMSQIVPYVRLRLYDEVSEWIQKGIFFIDSREIDEEGDASVLSIHGYDAMLKSEQDFSGAEMSWPNTDINVINRIASLMNVTVNHETQSAINRGYEIQLPISYTCREVLGYIAAMYAGNFVINDLGELQLLFLNGIPRETRYLIDSIGNRITFGGVRILL